MLLIIGANSLPDGRQIAQNQDRIHALAQNFRGISGAILRALAA
jgi:hypothetical protein